MENTKIGFELDGMIGYTEGNLGILRITKNVFNLLSSTERNSDLLPWFDELEQNNEIKGVMIINEGDCFGPKEYSKFLSSISGIEMDENIPHLITKFIRSDIRAIEINMLVNIVRKVSHFNKIFITAFRGGIVTPIFGTALAADFRLTSENSYFSLSHAKYGLHASGALPFFLPKYMSIGKATEYLINGGDISALDALNLWIVNEVFRENEFEAKCFDFARTTCDKPLNYIRSSKALIHCYNRDLERFLENESNFLYQ
ncbi:MAG: enoyl-CoA hydratase/isomerase family protein [Melioribacteraceae bacterium]